MGIEKVNVAADSYLRNAEFVVDPNEQQQEVKQEAVQVDKKPTGVTDPINEKGLKVQANPEDADPVAEYEKKAQEIKAKSEQTLKNLGIKPKSLEYSGTIEDFKTPKTVDDAKYRYRQMIYNGQIDKMSDEEIDEQAKLYIENKERKDKFESTHTFLDKAEYKKAEAEKDAYYEQLRKDGLSKKEAKAKAYEKFGENKYLSKGGWFGIGKSSARKFIERNEGLFYEKGKYSEAKHKAFVLEQAQRGNKDEGEAVNYRYSLKERREATAAQRTQGRSTTVHQQGVVAEAAGMSTEKNKTLLYSAVGTAATFGAGAILQAATGIGGAIGTFNACGQLCKGVTFPLGVPLYIKDSGEKVKHIKDIRPQIPPVEVPPEQPVVPQVEVPPEPQVQPEPCFEDAYCDSTDTIKRGDNWSKRILTGKGVTINGTKLGYDSKESRALLNAYIHAEKLQYGITDMTSNTFISQYRKDENGNKVANHFRYYTNFDNLLNNEEIMKKHPELELLRNATIVPDCDAVTKACKSGSPKKPYHSAGIPTDHKIPCE